MPSSSKGAEAICISGVMRGSQQLTVLASEVSLSESNGGWDFQTLGHPFSKSHLVSQHQRTCHSGWPCPIRTLCTVKGDKFPTVHMKSKLGKTVWVTAASGKSKPIHGIAFAQGPECTWRVIRKDGEVSCVPQGGLMLGEKSQ